MTHTVGNVRNSLLCFFFVVVLEVLKFCLSCGLCSVDKTSARFKSYVVKFGGGINGTCAGF